MYTKQSKKLALLNILTILRRYTDEDHRLNQKQIQDYLERDFDMKIDRKAVKRNITELIDYDFDINYTEYVRTYTDQNGEEQENRIMTDLYIAREFTDSELRLLVDSVLFSNHIPYKLGEELVQKLSGLSSVYFESRVRHIARMPEDKTDNTLLFYNIEMLDAAIENRKKVRFRYLEYRTDKKLHPRERSDGSVREYIINPYQLVAKDGKYYLICNNDKYDTVSNYRVDRMTAIELLDEKRKPFSELCDSDGKPLNLRRYMEKHIYMFAGEDVRAVFRIPKSLLSEVIDIFGRDVRFSDETPSDVTVTVDVNELAMEQFAKVYLPFVEILSPAPLRQKMRENLKNALAMYDQEA